MSFEAEEVVWARMQTVKEEQFNYWPGKIMGFLLEEERLYKIHLFTKNEIFHCFGKDILGFDSIKLTQKIYVNNVMLESAIIQAKNEYLRKKQGKGGKIQNQAELTPEDSNIQQTLQITIPNKFQHSDQFCQFLEIICQEILYSRSIQIIYSNFTYQLPFSVQASTYYVRRAPQIIGFILNQLKLDHNLKNLFQNWRTQIINVIVDQIMTGKMQL